MVQLYADGKLIYSPFMDGYELQGLTATVGVNKGGVAEIVMPPGHPAYNSFVSRKTIVTIYRAGKRIFRGRALYPEDDFYGTRTITCEGQRCFFRDSVVRPYLWQTEPATIFRELVDIHNSQVDESKRFVVGTITVTDPNNYVRLESEEAEQSSDVLDKLVERCGGFVTFSTNDAGQEVINWLATLDRKCAQLIEFGENLLDYSSSGENTDLATRIIPYGARDEATGRRINIRNVNGGLDYVQDDAAVARFGIITAIVVWDDVTLPAYLRTKALAELSVRKLIVTTLTLSAVDMSVRDRNIDSYDAGDLVPVFSAPHGLNDYFLLTEREYDLLQPENDKVTLGKQILTLTGAEVSGNVYIQNKFAQTAAGMKTEMQSSLNAAKEELAAALGSKVNGASAYMTSDDLLIQWGVLELASGAGHIEFLYPYEAEPTVQVTALGTTPSDKGCCVNGITVDGADVKTGTDVAKVNWLAIGKAGDISTETDGGHFITADAELLMTADGLYFTTLEGTA